MVDRLRPWHHAGVSRWAVSVVLALCAAGCTRLNAAFVDAQADSGGSTESTLDPTRVGEEGSASTKGDSAGTLDPTEPEPTTDGSTGGDRCIELSDPELGCDPYRENGCNDGQCRPYGGVDDLEGVACVLQELTDPPPVGKRCAHACDDQIGKDACPNREICDPFSIDPLCVPLCGGTPEAPICPLGSFCVEHRAGPDTFGLCRPGCSPFGEDCGLGQTCVPTPVGLGCEPAGELPEGEGCETPGNCAPGLLCVSGSDSGRCAVPCTLGSNGCPAGAFCQPIAQGIGGCVDR